MLPIDANIGSNELSTALEGGADIELKELAKGVVPICKDGPMSAPSPFFNITNCNSN